MKNDARLARMPAGRLRRGFTLLEVMLALGLSALALAAIAMAVDVHWRALQAGRRDVEEAQLARAVLHRMADDIRCAVQYDPQQAEKMFGDVVPASGDVSGLAESAGLEEGAELEELEAAAADTEEEAEDPASPSWVPPSVPALYGTESMLQVDISRLPRQRSSAAPTIEEELFEVQHVCDVKSVAYYLVDPTVGPTANTESSGLYRRELDRAVTAWAAMQNTLGALETQLTPMAREVTGLQFAYFDGASWCAEWDSVAMEGLPSAVEITIAVRRPARSSAAASWLGAESATTEDASSVYRLVVYLPGAHVAAATTDAATSENEEMAAENEEGTDTDDEEGTGGGGTGGGGTGGGGTGGGGTGGGGTGGGGTGGGGTGGGGGGGGGGPGGGGNPGGGGTGGGEGTPEDPEDEP